MIRELGPEFPNVLAIALAASHEGGSVVGQGCDDQYEIEFALDLLLDGFEKLRQKEKTSAGARVPLDIHYPQPP